MGWRTVGRGLFAAVVLVATLAPGASSASPRAGLEGGLNLAQLTLEVSDPFFEHETPFGGAYWLGLPVEFPFARRLALVCGPRYIEYGEAFPVTILFSGGPTWTSRIHATLQYLSVPLHLEVRAFRSRRLFVSVGPELGYLVGARETISIPLQSAFLPSPVAARPSHVEALIFEKLPSPKDRYYPWNLSAGAGVGWEAPLLGHTAQLHARFSQGLTDFQRNVGIRRTTRGIELGAGFLW